MDAKQSAADRIRPFLEALDRSIDSARRRRLNEEQADQPSACRRDVSDRVPDRPARPLDPTATSNDAERAEERPARLKARRKRPSGLDGSINPSWRFKDD